MTTIHSLCETCSIPFEHEPVQFYGKVIYSQRHCDDCCLKYTQDQKEEPARKAKDASRNRFNLIIPPIYHDTDLTRLPEVLTTPVASWSYQPMGLGFIGTSGAGKTRAAITLLKRMQDAGKDTFFLTAPDLSLNAANQFADSPAIKIIAQSALKLCKSADLLLLDDLGKGRMTDRAEAVLYDLLEYRTSHRLPTLWTSNSDAKGLLSMFSQDRGEAIVRRLAEFSTIVKL